MMQIMIETDGQILHCECGANLLVVLREHGYYVESPCNGNGKCGKCKVMLKTSPEAVSTDKTVLNESEQDRGVGSTEYREVLACMVSVEEDLVVRMPKQKSEGKVLEGGYKPDHVRIDKRKGYGIAVDIGTTTVAAVLIDLMDGKELASTAGYNAQGKYGADVLTRISYEYEHGECAIRELQETIVSQLNEMARTLCKKAGITSDEVLEVVIGANCTMTHLLMGADARSIGKAPYKPQFVKAQSCPAAEIGMCIGKNTMLYCLPQVSAYIGADITAGAYVCELDKKTGNTLFIDIGTNGEIVLSVKGRLLCCSCAAGPALEGMNISCGMQAADGAVEDIMITETGVELQVIGGKDPIGICGSGILAGLKELVRTGLIRKNGTYLKPEKLPDGDYRKACLEVVDGKREFVICTDPRVVLTQTDIRQVQMAKGAIRSGIVALLQKAGLTLADLDEVLIAGQFGAHLTAEALTGSGILPDEVRDRIYYVGNSSRTGAWLALLSADAKREIGELAEKMEYMELAETENYDRLFAECMLF